MARFCAFFDVVVYASVCACVFVVVRIEIAGGHGDAWHREDEGRGELCCVCVTVVVAFVVLQEDSTVA